MDGLIARILSNVDDGGACDGVRNTSLWLAAYPGVEGLGWENIGWKDWASRFLFSPSNSF